MSNGGRFFDEENLFFVSTDNLVVGPLTYPNSDGLPNQVIATNGKGHLSFVTTGSVPGNIVTNNPVGSTNTAIAIFNGTTGQQIQNSLATINGSGKISATGLAINGLNFPTSDGTNGQVLTTNGSGVWTFQTPAGGGNVSGPLLSTDKAVCRWSGTTGQVIQNSLATLSDAGFLTVTGFKNGALTFPAVDGTSGQVVTTNGSGVLTLQSLPSGGGNVTGPVSSTNNAVCTFNGTTGTLIQNSGVILTGGALTLTGLQVGALTYPSTDGTSGQVVTTNGAGVLSLQSIPTSSPSIGTLLGYNSTTLSVNIGSGDHIAFNTVMGSNGSTITLDVSSTYTTTLNTASIGRLTLQGGHSYILSATFNEITFALSLGSTAFQFYNADSGTGVGLSGSLLGTLSLGINNPSATAYVTPSVNTRYELRLTSVVSLSAVGQVVISAWQVN